ncbi:MAG: YnbE family lipoprotein [Candidatus Pacebacteria bacterium]|nr:YnbE family lipoprotein [Candidatus Paceibacterota bacterium]
MRQYFAVASIAVLVGLGGTTGCLRIKSDPVEVKPIHITVDVNLRVQKELANVFDEIDAQDPTIQNDSKPEGE